MIHNYRFDYIDYFNVIPVSGSISSMTFLFLKSIKMPIKSLELHSVKELLITMIPIAGTIYLLYARSIKPSTQKAIKIDLAPRANVYTGLPLPPSPINSSRKDSLSSAGSNLSLNSEP